MNEWFRVFRAFSDANRVRILELLCQGEQCGCVLLDELKIGQPTLSHHMKILTQSGIVKSRREGRWHYYAIDGEGCEHGRKLLAGLAQGELPSPLRTALALRRAFQVVAGFFAGGRGEAATPPPCRVPGCMP
jgi:ArsR family transcriptional regulator